MKGLIMFFFLLGASPVLSQQSGRLRGVVVEKNRRGFERATVTIQEPDSARMLVTITNSKGVYILSGLEIRKYNISNYLNGFEDKEEKSVEVVADYETSILVRMYKKDTKLTSEYNIDYELDDF